MPEFTTAARDRMLLGLTRGSLWIGLGLRRPDDEVTDPFYERQPLVFTAPSGNGTRAISNRDEVRFPGFMRAPEGPIRWWFVSTAREGGEMLWWERFERPKLPQPGEQFFIEAGRLELTQ